MNRSDSEATPPRTGEIRIRSNICTDPRAYHLVPGVLVRSYFSLYSPTEAQRREWQYLDRCTLCKRSAFEFNEEGCDHHVCQRGGLLSKADAASRNAERDRRAAEAAERPAP